MVKKNTLIVALWPVFRMSPPDFRSRRGQTRGGQNDEKPVQITNKLFFFTIIITKNRLITQSSFYLTQNVHVLHCGDQGGTGQGGT